MARFSNKLAAADYLGDPFYVAADVLLGRICVLISAANLQPDGLRSLRYISALKIKPAMLI